MPLVLWDIIGPLIRFEGLQEALLSAAWSLVDSCVTEVCLQLTELLFKGLFLSTKMITLPVVLLF